MRVGLAAACIGMMAVAVLMPARGFAWYEKTPGTVAPARCAALNEAMATHVRAARYAMPLDESAMSVALAMMRAKCELTIDRELSREGYLGITATRDHLAETGRRIEHCIVQSFMRAKSMVPDDVAAWRRTCSDSESGPPVAAWSDADIATVRQRTAALVAHAEALDAARQATELAMNDGAYYSPAGDNAAEHALRWRELARDDGERRRCASTLDDLAFLIEAAASGAARNRDRAEFDRLRALLTRIDPDMAALSRLNALAEER